MLSVHLPLLVVLPVQLVHLMPQHEPPMLELGPYGRQLLLVRLADLELLPPCEQLDLADHLCLPGLRRRLYDLGLLPLLQDHKLLLVLRLRLEGELGGLEELLPQVVVSLVVELRGARGSADVDR